MFSQINLTVVDVLAVALSATLVDDAVKARAMLHGNDQRVGPTENDLIVMGGCKDTCKDGDFGTFDTVFSGAGDDYLDGFDGGRVRHGQTGRAGFCGPDGRFDHPTAGQ
jgi:hypothetical protein